MRIETLEIFLSIVENGSISQAAKTHHLTQPAVTSQIQLLEMELGKPLFDRQPRQRKPVTLTKEGEIFLAFARNTLEAYDALIVSISNPSSEFVSVTIGTSPTNGTYIFPYLIEAFKRHFPSIAVDTKMKSGESIHDDIVNGVFDIAITTNNALHDREIVYEKLMSDPLLLIAHPYFPIKKTITVDQLKTLPLVFRISGATSKSILEKNLAKLSCHLDDLNIVLRVFDNESVKQAVKAGLAVGFVTASSISIDGLGEFKTVKIKDLYLERNLYLMKLKKPVREFTPAMQCFWNFALSKKWTER
ncbi:MAG: LysR family transcriptional regulator [Synergistaceae bacterium]|jgi:DNA-binding transcriptional LysR family regulator|nr:LysR family transcriptional regulator [Synergistaceae bacterium]